MNYRWSRRIVILNAAKNPAIRKPVNLSIEHHTPRRAGMNL